MIPLKLETLLKGRVVEQDRIEYKRGWNPSEIIRTICAFANDFPNVNGGYIVIGIDSEDGIPVLPPLGIPKEQLDSVQQQIFQYCNMIQPRYVPKIEVVDYRESGTFLLYLRCSAGEGGPYQSPAEVYSDKKGNEKADRNMRYWIRVGSVTASAKQDELSELFDKFNAVPYDDRVNRRATVDDIRRGYLEDFLRESNSSLVSELKKNNIDDLLVALEVANETDTDLAIRNIGVLMFADKPHKLIPGAQIDLVRFHSPEAEGADDFTERIFTGSIYRQIRDVMNYLDTTVFEKKIVKISGQAEATHYFNYPYDALEEILVNAVFHKSYREPEPVEIRVYVDCIMVINYPGPAKWIDMEKFILGKAKSRKYRNRRIGEFLKEIELSEKQCTGITKILHALESNGSPPPEFETDDERHYLIVTIRQHEGFNADKQINEQINEQTNEQTNGQINRQTKIVAALKENPQITLSQLVAATGISYSTVRREMDLLKAEGIIRRVGSKKVGNWEIVK